MRKPMKFKRYERGGEISGTVDSKEPEDKRSFLERMKSDFSRITAGNIDDPKSEAYKKYGAGRDAATTTENKSQIVARIPQKPRELTPNEESGYMRDLISSGSDIGGRPQNEGYRPNAGTASERAMLEGAFDSDKIVENTGPRTKPSKPAVVTKEALEKSGMSLREYMNKQQGLTARKEKDPTAGDSPDKAAQEAADAIDPGRDMRTPRYTPPGSAPKQTTQKPKPKVFMPSKPDNSFSGSKFSKGGSVSSASSRADGCATKGKTKGTMVTMKNGGMC